MVPHVLWSVVLSGVGHPVWMGGILAFARAKFMKFVGVVPPGALLFVGSILPCLGTRFLWWGWYQIGS